MADNYLENKMEALQARKAKEQRAKQLAWKKRMEAYKKRLEAEKLQSTKLEEFVDRPVKDENILNASEAAPADSACAKGQEGSASQE